MKKTYYIQHNIGKAKYCVSSNNGVSTHNDKSLFYDLAIFSSKVKLQAYVTGLEANGYIAI